MTKTFNPSRHLKNRYIQTGLASSKLRAKGRNMMEVNEEKIIFEVKDGVRLYGLYSRHKNSKGIVILLHGWEGSSGSAYIINTGRYLYKNGYSVFRLNFRDHGDSHYLNEGLFYAAHLDEVYEGIMHAAYIEKGLPAFVIGFSLGGNFALRTAVKNTDSPIFNLRHIVSVSPGIQPELSTKAIDNEWLLRKYFLRKWKKSLRKKETVFPEIYDFKEILEIDSCYRLTEILLEQFSEYNSAREYFNEYTIDKDFLKFAACPLTIITAEDDPIIPIEDFRSLNLNPNTELIILGKGGHNGFIENILKPAWYAKKALAIFDSVYNQ